MFRIVKRNDLYPVYSLFDEFFKNSAVNEIERENVSAIALDLVDADNEYRIIANLPGVKKEDVKIDLKDNLLTLSAQTENKTETSNENMIRQERFVGKYQRRFTLPDNSDVENIKAKMENGVLNLTVPKRNVIEMKSITVE